jgi:glycosyltransferase involved in cell wall biosynthesis
MIKIGFIGNYSNEWVGGVNYLKNLLYAIHTSGEKDRVSINVFVSKETEEWVRNSFSPYANIIETSALTPKSIHWYLWKITKRYLKTDIWFEIAVRSHKIDVFSHSNLYRTFFSKTINWIPDFQHLHLPSMFSAEEIESRNKSFSRIIRYGTRIILSSMDALNDFSNFAPEYTKKARVLRFVAQPNRKLLISDPESEKKVLEKHHITGPFFYLPNQFWKHKNHKVVFEALAILKKKNINITLVCSGKMNDYRNRDHIETLNNIVLENKLDIRMLGMIDYDDVIVLMKKSLAVINPSLFEGWSSTVEECKVIGKNLILSNIQVHIEQNPDQGIYFDPEDPIKLSELLLKTWNHNPPLSSQPIDLENQTKIFAHQFLKIVDECLQKN